MRILVASDHLPPHRSGHAVAAAWWVRRLADAGHRLTVVADAPPLPDVEVDWRRLPVLPGLPVGHPLAAFRPSPTRLRDVAEVRPDVIHLHGYGPACRRVLDAVPGVPVVVTLHAFPDGAGAPAAPLVVPVMRRMLRAVLRRAAVATVPSAAARRRLDVVAAGAGAPAVEIVPAGVDAAFRASRRRVDVLQRRDAPATFLYVGRRSQEKGFPRFERLARAHPEVDWHAIGSGPVAGDAPFRTSPQAEPARVAQAMREADALLVPGRFETQGIVTLEALHVGTAVAAPAGSAQAEPVVDGVNGSLYADADAGSAGDDAAWRALWTAAERTRSGTVAPGPGFAEADLVDRMQAVLERAIVGPRTRS